MAKRECLQLLTDSLEIMFFIYIKCDLYFNFFWLPLIDECVANSVTFLKHQREVDIKGKSWFHLFGVFFLLLGVELFVFRTSPLPL